jgi:hypothetical protein
MGAPFEPTKAPRTVPVAGTVLLEVPLPLQPANKDNANSSSTNPMDRATALFIFMLFRMCYLLK